MINEGNGDKVLREFLHQSAPNQNDERGERSSDDGQSGGKRIGSRI